MFEKLGWMVLSKHEGNSLKIKAYMESIHRLKGMIMKKMVQVEEKDRKDDLKILYDDICILYRAATKLLGKPDGMSGKPDELDSIGTMNTHKSMKKTSKKTNSKKTKKSMKTVASMMGGFF